MRVYLGPDPSLELIRYLRSINEKEGLGGLITRKRFIDDAINTSKALSELDETAHRWLDHVTRPIQVFVNKRSLGTQTKDIKTKVFGSPIPYGAFVDVGHGISVCSPAMTLVQKAEYTDIVDVIRIGMELCGTYSTWRLEPEQMGDSYYGLYEEIRGCTYGLPPAIKASVIQSFNNRNSKLRGSANAGRAMMWIADGSASPMESAVYMLLCLPKRFGGYGLPRPTMNPKVMVSNPDGLKERYPDLFWAGPNIDVEYNSDAKHSGEWSRYRDSKREIELTVAKMRVLPLTRPQVMDVDEFDSFANGLRRMLGVRARSKDAGWEVRRAELRRNLLGN